MTRLTARIPSAALVQFVPAAAMLALWLVWVGASGGYFQSLWYPSAVGAAVLLVATLRGSDGVLPRQRSARVALLAFAALTAVNYLSILWSGSKAASLEAADKLLLYLAVAWLFAILPWTPRALAMLLGAWSVGIAAFCAVGLLRATGAQHLDPFFVQFRYSTPVNYPNATAAIAIMGMWPALILSTRRELRPPLRAGLLVVAVFLCDFALLPQSRGGLLGLIVTAVLALLVAPSRLRLLARYAVVGGALAISVPRTVSVDDAIAAGRHAAPVLSRAAAGMLLTSIAALVLGLLVALIEDRVRVPKQLRRARRALTGRRGRMVLAVLGVVALSGASVAAAPPAGRLARSVWHSGQVDATTGSTRIFSVSPEERVDCARVALDLFVGAPFVGVGAADFGRRYDGLRRFAKHSQYVHNIELRALSETGVVGFGLFLAIVAALSVGLAATAREVGGLGRGCATAAFVLAAYFLIHASLDWLDEFPAIAAPALALPLAAIQMRGPLTVTQNGQGRRWPWQRFAGASAGGPRFRRPRAVKPVAGLVLILLAFGVGLALYGPYLSDRYVHRALGNFNKRPSGAYHDLSLATRLNPLSSDPLIAEGSVAEGLGDSTRSRAAFVRALGKEDDWYSWLQLALLDANNGHYALAQGELARAARLDVDDPLLAQAGTMIQHRQPIDPVVFNRRMRQGPNTTLFQTQNIK